MELPEDVIKIIKEYSMPITRPDWKHCGKINRYIYVREFKHIVMKRHYVLMSCTNRYIFLYDSYKPLFTIKRFDTLFYS